jgi:heptosyltransferase-1
MVTPGGGTQEKILIVRAGRGGDLIMITPALNALLGVFPGAEFHLLSTGDGRRIMAGYDPRLTRIFLYSRRFPRTLVLQRKLLEEFKAEGYTRIYIFETKPHYRNWLRGLAPHVHTLSGTGDDGHYCDRCLDLVEASLGAPVPRGWVTLPVSEEGRAKARALLSASGVPGQALLVGLHPTFSGTGLPLFRDRQGSRHRMWPPDSFSALARLLQQRQAAFSRPLAVIIDALPEELKYVQPIVDRAAGAVTLLAAPPDFQRYKGLLSLLDVLVTPNTGPMHMAAALGTPLVALFSDWSPADCGPYMDPARFQVLRAEDTDHPARGLAAITPETVASAVIQLASGAGRE